jgi:chromosome segregation ATPase
MSKTQPRPSSDFFGSGAGSVLNPVTLGWILGGPEVTGKGGRVHIQDEACTEAMNEIERLKRDIAFMASNDYVYSLTSEIERLKEEVESWKGGHSIAALDRDLAKDQIKRMEEALQRQDNEIIDLKALVTRAADALENYEEALDKPFSHPLIAELRKAAE